MQLRKDIEFVCIVISTVIAVIAFLLDHPSVLQYITSNVISFSNDGLITLLPLIKVIWLTRVLLALATFLLGYTLYKSIFDRFEYEFKAYFFGWLWLVSFIIHQLSQPVGWWGLLIGSVFLFILARIMYRFFFLSDSNHSKEYSKQ